ncbi:MAG: hypothetical protein ACI3XR_06995 [Eubacteriales bacterium]
MTVWLKDKKLLFSLSAAAGYLVGILIFCLSGKPVPELVPILPCRENLRQLLYLFWGQISSFLAVWLCGFVRLPFPLCLPVLIHRAAVTGYSAALLYAAGVSLPLYFSHTALCALLLVLLISLCTASGKFSAMGVPDRRAWISYLLTFPILSGVALILMTLCQLLLLFLS